MSSPTVPTNTSFSPFTQNITLLVPDGVTPTIIPLPAIYAFNTFNIHLALTYASQLGATLLLLPLLLLLTPSAKRRRPIFILNLSALITNFLRTLLTSFYLTSGFSNLYAYFALDFTAVPARDYANSVAADIFTVLTLLAIEASLIMQARVVCLTLPVWHQRLLLVVCGVVAGVAVGFRLALTIENCKAILAASYFADGQWLGSATNITATVSIWVFCGVFVAKLFASMRERRRMGMRSLRAVQVVAVMGVQTMLLPAVFAILAYFTSVPDLGSVVLTLVALFLPLSSLFASSRLDGSSAGSNNINNGGSGLAQKYLITPGSDATTTSGSGGGGSKGGRGGNGGSGFVTSATGPSESGVFNHFWKKNAMMSANGSGSGSVGTTTLTSALGSVGSGSPYKGGEELREGEAGHAVDLEAGVRVEREVIVTSEGV